MILPRPCDDTLHDVLHEVCGVVHHNSEQNYHGREETQLNFYKNIKAFIYVGNSLVGDVKL